MEIKYIGKCLHFKFGDKKYLVVGDLHLGFEESLNETGVFVNREMFKEMKKEFEEVFKKIGKVDKIILLGDVKHNFSKNLNQEWREVLNLFDYFIDEKKVVEIVITKGNHDNYLSNITRGKKVRLVECYSVGETCFFHGNKIYDGMNDKKIKRWVFGHMHPAIILEDNGKKEKYKCFLMGKYGGREVIVLPSFSNIRIGSDVRVHSEKIPFKINWDNFSVLVVGENLKNLSFGKLKDI